MTPAHERGGTVAWPLLLTVLGLALLGSTTSGAIQADDGLAVAAACERRLPEPAGYPLHALLGGLACRVPLGTPAARLSALSLVAGVWTLLALYFSIVTLTGNGWAGAVGALSLLTGRLFWSTCSHASPWPLGLALAATALWLGLRLARGRPRPRLTAALAGLCGGLALHGVEGAPLLALLVLAVLVLAPGPRLARLTAGIAGLLAGLAPQVWLVLAGGEAPLGYFLAGLPGPGAADPGAGLARFLVGVPAQSAWLLWPFAVLGALGLVLGPSRPLGQAVSPLRPAALGPVLGVTLLLWAPLRLTLLRAPVDEGGLLVPLFLLALGVGVGLTMVHEVWLAGPERASRRRYWYVAALVVIGLAALRNQRWADRSRRFAVEDHGVNCLSVARPASLVLGQGAVLSSTVAYAQRVLGLRGDVRYVDLDRPGAGDPLRRIQSEHRRGGTVYLARPLDGIARWERAFAAYPVGPLMRLMPAGEQIPAADEIERINERVFRGLRRRDPLERPELDPDGARLLEAYANAWRWIARALMRAGQRKLALRAVIRGQRWAPWLGAPTWLGDRRLDRPGAETGASGP